MAHWTDLPPDIGTILRRTRDLRLTRAINIFFRDDGMTMVSVQNPKNSSSYTTAHNEDPLTALVEALGPTYGKSWKDLLKPHEDKPTEDDDDDMMDVV